MGFPEDLTWLADNLTKRGHTVLVSKSNAFTKSLRGIEVCSEALIDEINQFVVTRGRGNLSQISFVGNSLGGIFNRHAIKLMADHDYFNQWQLSPLHFMTIATPHLGVYHHNLIEENLDIFNSHILKTTVSSLFSVSGKDLFANEEGSLLFKMGTHPQWLDALRLFKNRRLYANLFRDSVVPLSTGAILPKIESRRLRNQFKGKFGIVSAFNSTSRSSTSSDVDCRRDTVGKDEMSSKIIAALDSVGWEKIIVNFPGIYPLAHNQLCALTRWPAWLHEDLLGFKEGVYVMQNASDWLTLMI